MFDSGKSEKLVHIGAIMVVVLGLYFSSRYSYLLFHSLIEIFTIAIALTLFILTWNTRQYLGNSYLRLLGIGYGFIALVDLVHTLAYKGMGVFPAYDSNLSIQLWIVARYLQAATLLAAPLFVGRKLDDRAVVVAIAQDQESCIVFGMPKEAIHIGDACEVLPLQEIARHALVYLKQTTRNSFT